MTQTQYILHFTVQNNELNNITCVFIKFLNHPDFKFIYLRQSKLSCTSKRKGVLNFTV